MFAVITIQLEVDSRQPVQLPLPGMNCRAITEALEMIAMRCEKSEGSMYLKIIKTEVRDKE
jgi:hypothetical protein